MSFDTFSFAPPIQAGITAAGYSSPTPIQRQAIPSVLEGRDLLGLAQTGTGKTAAFALPILQRLLNGPRGKLRALILSPTRELAEQTHVAISSLGRQTRLRSLTLYGGVSQIPQVQKLRAGADIAVACPGRLLDLMGQKAVDVSGIQILVLDEADQMFDMGFLPTIRRILAALPKVRQTLLFSATMPAEIRELANEFLMHPVTVEIGIERPVETVSHAVYPVEQERKLEMLMALLNQAGKGQVLVFTRTKHRAKRVAQQLQRAGVSATSLQGNLSQSARQVAMDGFRNGRFQVMVATDIAARGIDVSRISHVINFDLPDTAEAYTHRTGRTGRMERLGAAFSLATPDDQVMLRTIERLLGQPMERRRMDGFEMPAMPVQVAANPAPRRQSQQPGSRPQQGNRPQQNSQPRQSNQPRQNSQPRQDNQPKQQSNQPRQGNQPQQSRRPEQSGRPARPASRPRSFAS